MTVQDGRYQSPWKQYLTDLSLQICSVRQRDTLDTLMSGEEASQAQALTVQDLSAGLSITVETAGIMEGLQQMDGRMLLQESMKVQMCKAGEIRFSSRAPMIRQAQAMLELL